jgi:hypothetical protein
MIKGMTQEYPTSLGTSDADTITLLGQNLATDLMGKVGFGELTLWMVTRRRPAQSEVRVFESVLVALADHGFTPTAIAARLTYLSAPGRARRRPARRRLPVPRGDRGRGPVPRRGACRRGGSSG